MGSPESPVPLLAPWQRKLAGWAVAGFSAAVLIACVTGLFHALTVFFATFGGVLWPLIVATVLSLLLEPVCTFFEKRLKLSRVPAILLLYLLVVAVAAGIALTLLPALWEQVQALAKSLPTLWTRITDTLATKFPEASQWMRDGGLVAWLKSHTQQLAGAATNSAPLLFEAGSQISGFVAKVTGLALVPVYLFYLLDLRRDFTNDLERESGFLPAKVRDDLVFLTRQFLGILISFFRGQLLVGLSIGVIMATGFGLIGLNYGLLLGLLIGLGNIIPYLGTMLGLAVVLPLAFFQTDGGGLPLLGYAIAVFVVAQTVDGYFITPRIMGKSTGLHPMAIILSVFFWGAAFDGLLGMVLAIPLSAFFVVLWRLMKQRYLPKS
jgi:predicted PurR-regulated permease PerM